MRGNVLAMMGEVMRIHETCVCETQAGLTVRSLQVEEHALGVLEVRA